MHKLSPSKINTRLGDNSQSGLEIHTIYQNDGLTELDTEILTNLG